MEDHVHLVEDVDEAADLFARTNGWRSASHPA
jgi:hypothetical protein